jgi:hypothetical protein
MAGESADEVARRRRAKAELLARQAESFARGAAGERHTAEALAQLPAGEWVALHDVRWPGRRLANIDHIVIGPGGVFVIDSKSWSGKVTLADGVLRQNGRSRRRALVGAVESAAAVAELLPPSWSDVVQPVLCFAERSGPVGRADDVLVCTTESVVHLLTSRPARLAEAEVQQGATTLRSGLALAVPHGRADPADGWAAGDGGTAQRSRRSGSVRSRGDRRSWRNERSGRRASGSGARVSARIGSRPGWRSGGSRGRRRPTPAGQLVRLLFLVSVTGVVIGPYGDHVAALSERVVDDFVTSVLEAEPGGDR